MVRWGALYAEALRSLSGCAFTLELSHVLLIDVVGFEVSIYVSWAAFVYEPVRWASQRAQAHVKLLLQTLTPHT